MKIINSYDSRTGNSKNEDLTHNQKILYILFGIQMIEIILAIFGICYVFCMLWIILTEFVEDFLLDVNYRDLNPKIPSENFILETNFMPEFGIINYSEVAVLKTVYYFVFTTLTTVGLGDYYPVGDYERLFGIPMMFVGVLIFSYVIGIYGEILEKFKLIEEEFHEENKLGQFIDTIKHFNDNEGLK